MVTAYDYPTAKILDEAEIDSILVGDSVGTNMLGYESERDVTIGDMIHHTTAVCRAVSSAFVIADLPYGCANVADDAIKYAHMLTDCGADCVKVEGWGEKCEIVNALSNHGITVCAHIGYNPQLHDKPQVFGKDEEQAQTLFDDAVKLQDAGAKIIVLEMVPKILAGKISRELTIPAIGIGSGNECDGQVSVVHDLLGISPKIFKHARPFADLKGEMYAAFKDYEDAVKLREFPDDTNSW